MSAAHTPGPWTCDAGYGNQHLRIDSESSGSLGQVRAFIPSGEVRHGSPVQMRWEEGFANARLIAAAPKLLAALRTLVDRDFTFFGGEMLGASRKITRDEVLAARDAIDEATGSAS